MAQAARNEGRVDPHPVTGSWGADACVGGGAATWDVGVVEGGAAGGPAVVTLAGLFRS